MGWLHRTVLMLSRYNGSMAKRPQFHKHGIKKGQICDWPPEMRPPEEVASQATYVGNPIHKSYPSPAGPPALKADEQKCDQYDIQDWPQLTEVLRRAILAHCIGTFRGEFPSRAWAWINGVLHEARLTGQGQGEYHGFPLDDIRQYPEPLERLERAPRVDIPINRV